MLNYKELKFTFGGLVLALATSLLLGSQFLEMVFRFHGANGNTDTQIMNFNVWDHVEVKKGANALGLGGSRLGGAINIITHTGRTAPGFNGRITFGSFDYKNPVVSYGWADDKADLYTSVAYYKSRGVRQSKNTNDNAQGFLSTGYRWNSNNETRLIVDIQDHRWEDARPLNMEEIKTNPRQNFRLMPIKFKMFHQQFSLRHSLNTDDWGNFSIGTFYMSNHYSRVIQNEYGDVLDHLEQERGVVIRNERTSNWFGKENHIEMSMNAQYMWSDNKNYEIDINNKRTSFNLESIRISV